MVENKSDPRKWRTVEEAVDGMSERMNAEVAWTQNVEKEKRKNIAANLEAQIREVEGTTELEKAFVTIIKNAIRELRK